MGIVTTWPGFDPFVELIEIMSLESSPPKGGLILVMGFLRVSVLQVFMLHPGLGVVLQVLQIVGLGKVMHLGELHGIGWYVEDL